MSSTNLTVQDVINPATASQWLTTLLAAATTLQLPATSWQAGGIARTILAVMSWSNASQDGLISMAAQGGFLDFAATGTVSVLNPVTGSATTVPVTTDPSTLTPTQLASWLPGWLDILADGSYNCQRIAASYAANALAVTNTTGTLYGPYAAGTFHVANGVTGATYANTATFSIAPASIVGGTIAGATGATPIVITTSAAHGLSTGQTVTVAGVAGNTAANGTWSIVQLTTTTFSLTSSVGGGSFTGSGGTVNVATVVPIQADQIGLQGTAAAGAINQLVTSLVGVSVSNTSALVGTSYESNVALAARCRLKLQSLSPNGPQGAYKYFALSAIGYLASINFPLTLANGPITRVIVQGSVGAGFVTTTIANAVGAPSGAVLQVTGAANNGVGLIRLAVASTSSISTGAVGIVSGVGGVTSANGNWTFTVIDGSHVDLQGSAIGAQSYTSGGSVQAGDVGLVDYVIQSNVVPLGTFALTAAAVSATVAVAATVYVPLAQAAAYSAAASSLLNLWFQALPIGGISYGGTNNLVPISDVEGVLYQAGILSGASTSYVLAITGLTLNGSATDVTLGGSVVAVPSFAIAVVGQ